MFKSLREWWLYWQYRNITRRWLLIRTRYRTRSQQFVASTRRARGTATYIPNRRVDGRGLIYVAFVAAVLAVVNTVLYKAGIGTLVPDLLLLAALTYGYLRVVRV